MKANELRVNVFVNDTTAKQNIQITDLDAWRIAEDYHYFEPIPLTEEWLVKFGFLKEGNRFFEKWVFRLFVDPKGFYLFIDYDYEYGIVKYVHELQNLYFCLSGEELTIK